MNTHHAIRPLCAAVVTSLLALASSAARADDGAQALDRVSIWLGGYYPDTSLDIRGQSNTQSDLGGRLHVDADRETVGRARLDFLVFDSQGFTLDYYTLDRTQDQRLAREFNYDGVPFQVDSNLQTQVKFSAGSAAWHWWFGSDTDVFGIGLGATYYKVELGFDGSAVVNGQEASASARWSEDAIAPMLTLGFKHAFSDSLRVYATALGVRKNGGVLDGHIVDGRVGVEWFPWHNFGFGAEYGSTRVYLKRHAQRYSANLDIDLDGPSLFARLRF